MEIRKRIAAIFAQGILTKDSLKKTVKKFIFLHAKHGYDVSQSENI